MNWWCERLNRDAALLVDEGHVAFIWRAQIRSPEAIMTVQTPSSQRRYLHRRLKDETRAALSAEDPKACAAHVQLASEYLRALNRGA